MKKEKRQDFQENAQSIAWLAALVGSIGLADEVATHQSLGLGHFLNSAGMAVGLTSCIWFGKVAGTAAFAMLGKILEVGSAARAGKEYVYDTLNLKTSELNLFSFTEEPSDDFDSDHFITHSFARFGGYAGMVTSLCVVVMPWLRDVAGNLCHPGPVPKIETTRFHSPLAVHFEQNVDCVGRDKATDAMTYNILPVDPALV